MVGSLDHTILSYIGRWGSAVEILQMAKIIQEDNHEI
jgi:hypothetical protein